MFYIITFNPQQHKSIITGFSYILTFIGLFLVYSAFQQYQQWSRHAKQKAHAVGKYNSPILSRTPSWSRWLNYSLRIPLISSNIDVKSLLYIFMLVVINAIYILEIPNKVYLQQRSPVTNYEIAGLRCALVGLSNISLALVMATRNSIVKVLSTKSFDEIMPLHRWHATMGLVEIAFHATSQLYENCPVIQSGDFFTLETSYLTTGFLAFVGLFCVFIGSRDFIRRRFFQVFYISHVFGVLLFIGAGFAHQYAVIVFLSPSVLLHFSDRIIRAVRIRVSPPQSVEIKVPNKQEITQIVFTQDGNRKPQPGQFVFVSINDGTIFSRFANFFNWHPFTISEVFDRDVRKPESATIANDKDVSATLGSPSPSTEHDYEEARNIAVTENVEGPFYASVHIKGVGSETRSLNRQANNEPQCLKVKVDGPYGSSAMTLEMNQVVTFFEAGIGITPSLTMFRDLAEKCVRDPLMVHTTHIYFIWAIPNIEIAKVFLPQLVKTVKIANGAINPPKIRFELYLTRCSSIGEYENPLPHCRVTQSRPDIKEIMSRIDSQHPNVSVAAQVCGPTVFMREVNNSGNFRGWRVRQETFEF